MIEIAAMPALMIVCAGLFMMFIANRALKTLVFDASAVSPQTGVQHMTDKVSQQG